jgi:hypothetical protein
MFGMFKKGSESEADGYDPDQVTVHYEGGVVSPDYTAETLNREDINDQGYPYHALFPHGKGKLVYKLDDAVMEQYEGEFEFGQYQGKGTLIDRNGEVHEGEFKANLFIK